jgi:hypothetical protein
MSDLQAMAVAVFLGASAVFIVSAVGFHAPYRISDIRYAAIRERYYFAIVVYSTIAVVLYLIALECLWLVSAGLTSQSGIGLAIAIPAAIVVVVLVPRVPFAQGGISRFRSIMQALARYPQAVEAVTAIISRSPFEIGCGATSEVTRELEGYGVPARLVERALADKEVLAISAVTMIRQVCSLHISFSELRDDRRFQKFFLARDDVFYSLEKRYRQLLRRSARAFLLAENIPVSDLDSGELALEISDFIAQECEDLRGDYQRLLAEAALSSVHSRPDREELISKFGYRTLLPEGLPFVPLVVTFTLDFVISVAPLLFLLGLPVDYAAPPRVAVLLVLAHAVALTLSLFFAVYPKALTNFARPSLFALPWRSYVLFGMASYLIGTAVLSVTYARVGLASGWLPSSHPIVVGSLISLVLLVNTVALSVLLDVRLRNASLDFHGARLRDGTMHAIVMMSTMFILVIAFQGLSAKYAMALPISWTHYAFVVFLSGVLGFVMGYLVPSTAEAYIDAEKFIRRLAERDGYLLDWAAQDYHPREIVRP